MNILNKIEIVIADDHEIFRKGFKLLFKNLKEVVIVGEADNGKSLIESVDLHKPDIVITDIQMPEMNGVDACRAIRKKYPDMQVIALTSFNDDHFIVDMLEAGASGYLLKNTNKKELQEAIEAVYSGDVYYSVATSNKLARLIAESKANPGKYLGTVKFSEREISIIRLICQELTNKEIASRLNLSMRTVESHREKIQQKTGARNTAGIVVYAMKHGLSDL